MDNKKIIIAFLGLLLFSSFVYAEDCPQGQKYDSYWQRCQNICNSYQEWDPSGQRCVNKVVVEDKPLKPLLKGKIINYTGRVFIERGIDLIKPAYNEPLYSADTVIVEEGARAVIEMDDGQKIVIEKKMRYTLSASELAASRTSKITLFFGGIWVKMKKMFHNEEFEIKTPTDSGRRG